MTSRSTFLVRIQKVLTAASESRQTISSSKGHPAKASRGTSALGGAKGGLLIAPNTLMITLPAVGMLWWTDCSMSFLLINRFIVTHARGLAASQGPPQ